VSERQRARAAKAEAAEIHLELACLYEKLVELEEQEAGTANVYQVSSELREHVS
jgi:hypothetical protein